jgi:hypothetical protein
VYKSQAELGRALVRFAPNAPHAQTIVDRMARTLRRSPLGWEGELSLSQPVVSRAPELTDKIEHVKPPRRTWPWAIGVFGFGAIAAALAVVLASRGGEAAAPLPAAFLDHAKLPAPAPAPVPAPVREQPAPVVVEAPPQTPAKPIHHGKHSTAAQSGSAAETSDVPTPPRDPFTIQHGSNNQ